MSTVSGSTKSRKCATSTALVVCVLATLASLLFAMPGRALAAQAYTTASVAPSVKYEAHISNIGWMSAVSDGATAGTTGRALQVEAIKIQASNLGNGGIRYQAHVSDVGWQGWKQAGQVAGTTGQNRKVEGVKIELTGDAASKYDVLYRVHVPDMGWLAWTKNGAVAGSTGMNLRIEAIQVKIAKKGTSVSGVASLSKPSLKARAHSANIGWQSPVSEGATAGTTGRALRLEALSFDLKDFNGTSSAISARAHVSDIGWMNWASSSQTVGTTGKGKAMEAIQIKLTGNVALYYDVYYRAHVSNYGWLGWAKNGETAGSTGMAAPMEAVQVKVVRKGSPFNRGGSAVAQPKKASAGNQSSYNSKVNSFLNDSRWRNGSSWSSGQRPKLSGYSASGCCAYAVDFCQYVFGASSYRSGSAFSNPRNIRAGDVIKVTGSQHWFVVLSRSGDSLYTAEGNWGGKVVVTNGTYQVHGNTLYRNGSKFRTFSAGYHMQ